MPTFPTEAESAANFAEWSEAMFAAEGAFTAAEWAEINEMFTVEFTDEDMDAMAADWAACNGHKDHFYWI